MSTEETYAASDNTSQMIAAAAKAFNPKITASNPRNVMKGDTFCIERYVLET